MHFSRKVRNARTRPGQGVRGRHFLNCDGLYMPGLSGYCLNAVNMSLQCLKAWWFTRVDDRLPRLQDSSELGFPVRHA